MAGYLKTLADTLTDAGLELPPPVACFFSAKAVAFGLTTRQQLPDYCRANDWSDAQAETLVRLVALITNSAAYRKAVVNGAFRMNLDGSPGEPITDADRAHAAHALAGIAKARAKRQRPRLRQPLSLPRRRLRPMP